LVIRQEGGDLDREASSLVVGKIEAVDEHAGAHGDLLALVEEILHVAVQRHDPDVYRRQPASLATHPGEGATAF
jgi:hypothetical protein